MGRKISYEEVKEYIESRGCELLNPTYINNKTKLDIRCKCGKIFKRNFHDFKDGSKELCPDCANIQKGLSQRNRKIVKCDYCNKEIERCESTVNNMNFCDKKCQDKWQSENCRCKCNCDYCGKELERPKSLIKNHNFCSGECKGKWMSENLKGENNPNFKPEIDAKERITKRNYPEYRDFREKVFERDNYTCQCCGRHGGKLRAHHFDGYHWDVEHRTDVDNGITLCDKCHDAQYSGSFHSVYRKGDNTKEQFIEFLTNKYKETQDQHFIDLIEKINNRLS